MQFPDYKQVDQMDCGPTCIRMIIRHTKIKSTVPNQPRGRGISEAAEKIRFRTLGVKLTLEQLKETPLPCILHWRQHHFVVLYRIKKNNFFIADPAKGNITYTEKEFTKSWFSHKEMYDGISLLLTPSPQFYEQEEEKANELKWGNMLRYFYTYRKLFIQLVLGLCIGTLLSLITPFLTQSVVDIGINTRNLNFVYLILIAQVMLFIGSTSVNFIRSWILLHISTRINIAILTDFLIKLMKLPLSFFETKTMGDIMQRMNEQQKIASFLTGTTLSTLFSMDFSLKASFFNGTLFLYWS